MVHLLTATLQRSTGRSICRLVLLTLPHKARMLIVPSCLYPVQLQRERANILRDLCFLFFFYPTGNNSSQVRTRLCL